MTRCKPCRWQPCHLVVINTSLRSTPALASSWQHTLHGKCAGGVQDRASGTTLWSRYTSASHPTDWKHICGAKTKVNWRNFGWGPCCVNSSSTLLDPIRDNGRCIGPFQSTNASQEKEAYVLICWCSSALLSTQCYYSTSTKGAQQIQRQAYRHHRHLHTLGNLHSRNLHFASSPSQQRQH